MSGSCGGRCRRTEPEPGPEWDAAADEWSLAASGVVCLPRRGGSAAGHAIDRRNTTVCPHRLPYRFWRALNAWRDGRHHPGPRWPGSLMEQPAWLFDAVVILESEYSLIEAQRAEEARGS